MNRNKIISEIGSFIRNKKDFLIVSHYAPDGDNIGSSIAIYLMLKNMGKQSVIVNEDGLISRFKFLIDNKEGYKTFNEHGAEIKYKNIIAVDTANMERIGKVKDLFTEDAEIVNIDHHFTNSEFGNINFVDGSISSAAQLVLEVFEKNDFEITKNISDALLTGVLTDTGSLRFQNTDTRVMEDVTRLMKYGSDLYDLMNRIFMSLDYDESIKINKIASEIKLYPGEKVAVAYNDQKNNPLIENEPVLMILSAISEADISLFVREQGDNKIKISLRSKSDFNVSDFASKWGGGGHKNAAGMRYSGTVEEFNNEVLSELLKAVASDE